MRTTPLLSCVILLDEFPWNHHIPWRASLASALRVADEVIVVLGHRKHVGKDIPVRHHLKTLSAKTKLKVISLTWPDDWNWMFIAHALNMGLLHASGKWICRLLMDEIFPDGMEDKIHSELRMPGAPVRWCHRDYVLGRDKLYPAGAKPFFFRRGCRYVYGRVDSSCQDAVMFDNPVMLSFSSACKFFLSRKDYLMSWPLPPLGKRDFKRERERERDFQFIILMLIFTQEKIYWRKNLRLCGDMYGFLRNIREISRLRQKKLLQIISIKLAAFLAQKDVSLVMTYQKMLSIFLTQQTHKMLLF